MRISLTSGFVVRKGEKQREARIFSEDGKEVAELRGDGAEPAYRLTRKDDNREWLLSNKIGSEHRRFSFSLTDAKEAPSDGPQLTILDNIFRHNGKFYMFANHPSGKSWRDYVANKVRYISRLDNFPYSGLAEMAKARHDQDLRHKLKRFRGIPVGEAYGLGATQEGHHVRVNDELDDIGLFLAATSYLMYASA